ncbi:hypothetical protein S7335_4766 [Synechococcus sp. PCC 7335]|uniref:DUF2834 domain-containing protein n=1 Tax=Synechococcus sp. (strain ATCC 29403 / PCC 7335) TaxID=91464 RepID=UPI00017EE3F3|nr:DUF2834 domain-containing protein [Synechococcus sp. PCC 7335]EDX87059.1 hypothetical protein S7335_4766 [Synechococcus sp. PCC 7335]
MQTILTQTDKRTADVSRFYGICSALSVIISWGIFSQFLLSGDASISSFFEQAFSTPVSTLFSSDIVITALIFLAFARIELKRLGMPAHRLALYALATYFVGICCSLSLFLYQREQWLNREDHSV